MDAGIANNILDRIRYPVRMYSFLDWTLLGICGIVPDIDHLGTPEFARCLHIPMLVVAWLLCIAYIARSYRLFH